MTRIPASLAHLANSVAFDDDDIIVRLADNFEFTYEYREGKWVRTKGGPIKGICSIERFLTKAQEADEVMEEVKKLAT